MNDRNAPAPTGDARRMNTLMTHPGARKVPASEELSYADTSTVSAPLAFWYKRASLPNCN